MKPNRPTALMQPCRLAGLLLAAPLCLLASVSASAKPAEVRISVDSELNFGTFMVFGSGRRSIGPNGIVVDEAIIALENTIPRPAQFTVTYDRGNESKHVLDIELELFISPTPGVTIGGVEGRLTNFETDLSGASRVTSGQPIRITLPNCRTRTCSQSFRLGATLNVTRSYGGAVLIIPIPVDAVIISDDRQRK